MVYSVLFCLSVTSLMQLRHIRSEEVPSPYECGRHGKFEYCIDGIPGCVIGCHCHPGYYFDTETKICEPNVKLSEDFKRIYMSDPNRIYPLNTPTLTQNIPTQTTVNTFNERVDELSKDTDDIGEWLYNQFFKTIETQVINNTSDIKPLTRRKTDDTSASKTNGDDFKNTPVSRKNTNGDSEPESTKKKRKTRKFSKSRGKKSKSKVHGLRRKLLRITEDDSLFDSDSHSDSDEDTSSSSSKSSSESSSSEDKVKKEDRDHDHKKVIIFNRRPRPPLPSFIFLPNMDTHYYPPIGLPPPPVLPMYPMVPVPPMAPFLPYIGYTTSASACDSTTISSTAKDVPHTTSATKDSSHSATETTPEEESTTTDTTVSFESTPESSSPEPDALKSALRTRSKLHRPRKPPPAPKLSGEMFMMRSQDLEPSLPLTAKQLERINLVNALKERLKMKKKIQNSQNNDAYDPIENIDLFEDIPSIPARKQKHQNQNEIEKKLKDVDFKYLSQLIHRANLNVTESPPLRSRAKTEKLRRLPETRRMYDQETPFIHYVGDNTSPRSSAIKDQDDQYFMNLGRQIASLIRDEDAKVGYTATETPEPNNLQESINSLLNEHRYSPRSYWERFVRSPLSSLKSYLANLHYYKENNDMNLFSLEDEVNIFASTARPLSLQDIENMLTNVQKTNTKMNNNYKTPRQPDVSFNVNLLPKKNIKVDNVFRRMFDAPEHINYIPGTKQEPYTTNNKQKLPINYNVTNHLQSTNTIARQLNFKPDMTYSPNLQQQTISNLTRNKIPEHETSNNSSKLTIKHVPNNLKMNTNIPKKFQREYLKFLKKSPIVINPNVNKPAQTKFPEFPPKYLMIPDKSKPTLMNYKSLNYFTDARNKHHYMFEASYPLDTQSFRESLSKRIETGKPSYFHHEFHHFDYFD